VPTKESKARFTFSLGGVATRADFCAGAAIVLYKCNNRQINCKINFPESKIYIPILFREI